MPSFLTGRVAGAAAAGLVGIPLATVAFLRLKFGPSVFNDLQDIRYLGTLSKIYEGIIRDNIQLSDIFEEHARNTPEKVLIFYKDEAHTYGVLDKVANQFAHFVQRSGEVTRYDAVAIFMYNEPTFIVIWLALAKMGIKVALLNYNLKGSVLLHCIKACNAKAIVCGRDPLLLETMGVIKADLDELGIVTWVPGGQRDRSQTIPDGMILVDAEAELSDPIPRELRHQSASQDVAMYMFTSGTTGLPKPVKITHFRLVASSYPTHPSFAVREDDVIYTALPLYHGAAFQIAFARILRVGGKLALSNFSASRFWQDVRKYKATIIPYVGEMCRYLLNQPPRQDDGKYSHKIRFAVGVGMSSDIWVEFQRRFNIERIHDVYGATEGTFGTVNTDGRVGSVGRYSPLMKAMLDVLVLVKCNTETAQPLRGPDGKCIATPPGETGLLLCRLKSKEDFDGYLGDKKMNEKKLVMDVKKIGDVFFNTGDLMMFDKDGYLYFKDRLGDTFRWKGENVATTEVAAVVNGFPGVKQSNVYGVQVSGHDGRAGMAAINLSHEQQFDLKGFYDHVVKSLPLYACPKFLRLVQELEITGTFKLKKTDLVREGFDPNVVSDPLFFMDTERKTYAPLGIDAWRRIVIGLARL